MKTIIIASICLMLGFGIAYTIFASSGNSQSSFADKKPRLFTCGMHPEIISDEPGYCPICEMKLTPKNESGASSGSIQIDPNTIQNMNLVTTRVRYNNITRKIRAFGKVEFSDPHIFNVNLKVPGWVEDLHVDRDGEKVYRGQPLVRIYSPELIAAQKELLIAHRSVNSGNMRSFYQSARGRLANYDISEDQIDGLLNKGEIVRTMTITSPVSGIVVKKSVNDGDHLKPGKELYRIADLSEVWITAAIYEQDLPFVKEGMTVEIRFPNLPGRRISSPIAYISPFLDKHNQVEIRLEVSNPDLNLRPDMYAEVTINSELPGSRLVIPRAAVINSGAREIVYVATGNGGYAPRQVTTGIAGSDDLVEIIEGLDIDDDVITRGQFLLDSESRLSEAVDLDMHRHSRGNLAQTAGETIYTESGQSKMQESFIFETHDVFTCPMPSHFHVLQYGKGNCPECAMKLVPITETDNTEVYICPMRQCEVVQNKPGECPVCGMDLVKFEMEHPHD